MSGGEKLTLDVAETKHGLLPYILTLQDTQFTLINTTLANRLHGANADPAYVSAAAHCYNGKSTGVCFSFTLPEI